MDEFGRSTDFMGAAIIVIGIVLYLVGWLGSVLLAFEESGSLGLWVLLVPVVWLYFVFTRIDRTAKYVAISFAGLALMLVGIFFLQAPG
jgi:hypothetical protein